MEGFPHLLVRLAPLENGQSFLLPSSTIIKETVTGTLVLSSAKRQISVAGDLLVIFVKGKR